MRYFLAIFVAAACLAQSCGANATTVTFDISSQVGFQQNGVAGTAGNGIVFLSPVYTVGFGDTVDFGTAYLAPDFIDGRSNCFSTNSCFSNYAYKITFLTNASDGLATAPFDLGFVSGSTTSLEYCPNFDCPLIAIPLLFNLPSNVDGLQLAFQGSALSITAPVPEPSTWAMLLIGFAGLAFAGYRRRHGTPIAVI